MEFSQEARNFLTRIQGLEFACDDPKTRDPSSLADCYRNLYLEMSRFDQPDKSQSYRSALSKQHKSLEAQVYLERYADVVDKLDETGLNNFAEGAIALSDYHVNESTKWKTTLSVDKILKTAAKNGTEELEEDTSEDCIITLHSSKKPPDSCAMSESASYAGSARSFPYSTEKKDQFLNFNQPSTIRTDKPSASSTNSHLNTGTGGQLFRTEDSPSLFTTNNFNPGTNKPFVPQPSRGAESKMFSSVKSTPSGGSFQFGKKENWQQKELGDQNANFGRNGSVKDFETNACDVNRSAYGNMGRQTGNRPWRKRDKDDCDNDDDEPGNKRLPFKTAKQQLVINQQKKYGNSNMSERTQVMGSNYGAYKKSLGTRRGPASKFIPPILNRDSDEYENPTGQKPNCNNTRQRPGAKNDDCDEPVDERLKGIDPKMIELIQNEIMDHGPKMTWSDIAGLEFAKKTIKEIVVWPMLRPDIFTGLRGPPKGLLLFGPPGTGKTLIGKCIASQSKSTFFCISASSLTSKWVGEGEKMVRALFAVARCNQPAVVFIDEIDSLLSQRSETEHESSRRIKTEFLVQLDGAATESEDRILIIGATNRPQEIDEAARRRFVKRLLIPLPESIARCDIVKNLMSQQKHDLSQADIQAICDRTDGYSGADMTNLCREAALGPIRSIPFELMETITPDQVRPILYQDFEAALLQVRASVSQKDLLLYTDWNKTYGSFGQ